MFCCHGYNCLVSEHGFFYGTFTTSNMIPLLYCLQNLLSEGQWYYCGQIRIYFTLNGFFLTNDKAFRKDDAPCSTTIKHVTSIYNIILRKMKDKLARKHEFICIKSI